MLLRVRCPRCATLNDIEADVERRQARGATIPFYGSETSPCKECKKVIIVNFEVTANVTAVSGPEWDNFREINNKIMDEIRKEGLGRDV